MSRTLFAALALSLLGRGFAAAAAAGAAEPGRLTLSADGRAILVYNAQYLPSPDPDAPWFGRSGFIHPVYSPSGRVVTDGFPKDHLHQHGLMFAWTSSQLDGRPVDFWNSAKREGKVEHARTVHVDHDQIVVRLRHVALTGPEPVTVLEETWRIVRVAHPTMNVFDLESIQTCATDRPLHIAQYHYGAMCVRGAESWFTRGVTMLTSEGKDQQTGNHTRPRWVAAYGVVDGAVCGIAAMSHPTNFRSPQPVRLHPTKPYFCFAPMVLGDFQIEPGKPYVSRFRFAAFDGEADADQLNALWKAYTGEG